jgi:hypothetical protein
MSADKISTRPQLDKLGVKPGDLVAVIGVDDPSFASLLGERLERPTRRRLAVGCALIFYAADSPRELARLKTLRAHIVDSGAIWVVSRKGKAATLKDIEVIAAAKNAGLVDTKVVAFSPTHTALKLVIPRALRAKGAR